MRLPLLLLAIFFPGNAILAQTSSLTTSLKKDIVKVGKGHGVLIFSNPAIPGGVDGAKARKMLSGITTRININDKDYTKEVIQHDTITLTVWRAKKNGMPVKAILEADNIVTLRQRGMKPNTMHYMLCRVYSLEKPYLFEYWREEHAGFLGFLWDKYKVWQNEEDILVSLMLTQSSSLGNCERALKKYLLRHPVK